jgi:hypothetical protein
MEKGRYIIDGGIHFVSGYKPGTVCIKSEGIGAADPAFFTDMKNYGKLSTNRQVYQWR